MNTTTRTRLFDVSRVGNPTQVQHRVLATHAGQAAILGALDYARERVEHGAEFVRVSQHETDDSRAYLSLTDIADDPETLEFVARQA